MKFRELIEGYNNEFMFLVVHEEAEKIGDIKLPKSIDVSEGKNGVTFISKDTKALEKLRKDLLKKFGAYSKKVIENGELY